MSERIYRDPVHNIIRLRTDTDEGELMMRLIDRRSSKGCDALNNLDLVSILIKVQSTQDLRTRLAPST